jgi:cobalt-zinc-cadmium efflux system outer membrane protein
MNRISYLLIPFCLILNNAEAQYKLKYDTIAYSVQDAENLFFKKNYYLLAARYQISEADAALMQAKLWDNPNFSLDKEAYNKPSGKWFLIPNTGEIALSFQQLVYLAGKRNKRINIEKFNSQIAQYQFYDLIRTLHYELRTNFFDLYFLQQSLSVYDHEISALKSLVDAYASEYQKGNLAFKELARLHALEFNLENEKIEVLKNLTEKQANLILLTADSLLRPIKPLVNVSSFDKINPSSLNLDQLFELGLTNRYDLKVSETQLQTEQMNLSLQKAMRIPDMTIGANYDRAGSYIPNYNSISLSFDLPFWNRNQGNIKQSEFKIEENKVLKTQKELEVKSDITKAYVQLAEMDKLYKSSIQKFDSSYEKLFSGITSAYKNHSINLLEFIDYYETYKNSKNEYFHLENNRLEAVEDLNLATGTIIFK